jgi:perosamine synthetase
MAHLQANGIGCAPYFPTIHLQPHYRDRFGFAPGDFPVCEKVAARTLALPFHCDLSQKQVERIGEVIAQKVPELPRT